MSSYAVGKYDFCIPKGTDIIVPFRFRDSEGNLIDFGGFEARMQIRRFVNSSLVIDELTTYNARITVNVEEGTLTLHFPHALTEQYPTGQIVYDIELVSADGIVARVVEGRISVTSEVTRALVER